jgi:hypothetical protein
MLSVWGDGYTKHPDLIIPQVHTYPNNTLHPQICSCYVSIYMKIKYKNSQNVDISYLRKAPAFKVIQEPASVWLRDKPDKRKSDMLARDLETFFSKDLGLQGTQIWDYIIIEIWELKGSVMRA